MFCIFIFVFIFIYLFLIFPAPASKQKKEPFCGKNIAHRGLHSKDTKIPENSLSSFSKAVEAGYGIELDLQLTRDGKVVHDATLERVCGVKEKLEDLTYQELLSYSLFHTGEKIPLFSEVLSLVNGKVPLVIEIKNGKKNTALCTQVLLLLRSYSGVYCIESFHPLIVGWFRKYAPDILRGQLSAPAHEFSNVMPFLYRFGLSRLLSNFYARPNFIAYRKGKLPWSVQLCLYLGALRFVWTAHPEDNIKQLTQNNDVIIFEFYHPNVSFSSHCLTNRH